VGGGIEIEMGDFFAQSVNFHVNHPTTFTLGDMLYTPTLSK